MSAGRISVEAIRAALGEAAVIAGDGRACPPAERLVLSGRGDLPPDGERNVVLHIASCTACAAAWRVARELGGESAGRARTFGRKKTFARPWLGLAAAALLVVVIGGGILVFTPERTVAPVYREQDEDTLRSLIPDGEALPRERFVLRWAPAAEGALYDVLVTDEWLDALARGTGLDSAEFLVPESALEGVKPGAHLFWQVSAHLPDGRRIESPTFIVSVR